MNSLYKYFIQDDAKAIVQEIEVLEAQLSIAQAPPLKQAVLKKWPE